MGKLTAQSIDIEAVINNWRGEEWSEILGATAVEEYKAIFLNV